MPVKVQEKDASPRAAAQLVADLRKSELAKARALKAAVRHYEKARKQYNTLDGK